MVGQIEGSVSVLELGVLIEHLHAVISDLVRRIEALEARPAFVFDQPSFLPQGVIGEFVWPAGGTVVIPAVISRTDGTVSPLEQWTNYVHTVQSVSSQGG